MRLICVSDPRMWHCTQNMCAVKLYWSSTAPTIEAGYENDSCLNLFTMNWQIHSFPVILCVDKGMQLSVETDHMDCSITLKCFISFPSSTPLSTQPVAPTFHSQTVRQK